MSVYRRYFKVTTGPLVDRVKEIRKINKQAREKYLEILKSIGARSYVSIDDKLSGVMFDYDPDKSVYRKCSFPGAWYPKKNSKVGKAIANQLNSVKVEKEGDALDVVGLTRFAITYEGYVHFTTITVMPSEEIIIVGVPWLHDADILVQEYKKAKKAGLISCDSNIDHLMWEPTPEMTEIKEWEFKKIISDYNESFKGGEK